MERERSHLHYLDESHDCQAVYLVFTDEAEEVQGKKTVGFSLPL